MASVFSSISRHIWDTRYRYRDGKAVRDVRIEDTWRRVARALAAVEGDEASLWESRFYRLMEDFRFLPGGRILAGAGTGHRVTLFNCFVMGVIEDSIDGIFDALKEGALTMQQGGGVGYDFSTLRPSGTEARGVGAISSGPVSFMRVWDSMCATLLSTGSRRGAMMATLRCDHPDIEAFVDAKRDPSALRHFNLSVLVSDELMQAVERDEPWPLVFPADRVSEGDGPTLLRCWSGLHDAVPCAVLKTVSARSLWNRIMQATYDNAEPGVLFIDRINRENNLGYRERISATNPCGEIPLPPYGACDLGSLNLTRFVRDPFEPSASVDLPALETAAMVAVRMLDNATEVSHFPLAQQAEEARATRRLGLGFTGLADALIMLGFDYRSLAARKQAEEIMRCISHAAYAASVALAREKGAFPAFAAEPYLESPFIRRLPEALRGEIARHGTRNSHLLAIAPAGTISLLAGNVSSGIEPVFAFQHRRRVLEFDGGYTIFELVDHALQQWREQRGDEAPPAHFVCATDVSPSEHLQMQAAVQPYVDNAISKTINVPESMDFETFKALYLEAYRLGLKGCTTFRPNPVTGAVLTSDTSAAPARHCCAIEREAD